MLIWFDENPDRYWWLVCCTIAATLFLLLRPLLRPAWQDRQRTDWGWSLAILVVLMAGRWPTWYITRQFNPDESQLIAGAITLRHDPVFWRSVDGATAGPLDFFALLPAGWIHGADDYFSARLTALGLIAVALIFAHQTIALAFGRLVARVTGFGTLCFESLTLHNDLLHYSTELVPVSLLAVAFFLAVQRFVVKADWRWNAVGGLLLGAIPLTKLQAMPLAVFLGLGWIIGEWWLLKEHAAERRRRLVALCAGASVPLIVCALLLTATGQWRNAMISYFLHNLTYVDAADLPLKGVLAMTWRIAIREDPVFVSWILGGGLWLLLLSPLLRTPARPARLVAAAATAFFLVSLICIAVPRRPFLHYGQFLVVPWTLVLGSITGLVMERLGSRRAPLRCGVLCAAVLCTTGGLLYLRASLPPPWAGRLTQYQTHPQGAVAKELRKYAQAGEALGIWGCMSNYYVEANLRQATREAHSQLEIIDSPHYDYFRQRYLADFRRSAAPVFVDAVGPGNYLFQNRALAHEVIFPELAAYVQDHYTPVAAVHGSRIYVRKDRLIAAQP
jgi:hypothetical protein